MNRWIGRLLAGVIMAAAILGGSNSLIADEGECVEVSVREAGGGWEQVGVFPCPEGARHTLETMISFEGNDYPVQLRVGVSMSGPVTIRVISREINLRPEHSPHLIARLQREAGATAELKLMERRFSYEAGPTKPRAYYVPVVDYRFTYL